MTLTPEAEIALFLRRLKWAAVIVGVLWVVSLLAPILTPLVLALLLAWLGDPLVDRIERAGRSRNVAVVLVFVLATLLFVLALMILVPMIERQIMTLIDALPQMRNWAIGTAIPWLEAKTGRRPLAIASTMACRLLPRPEASTARRNGASGAGIGE